jgi:hypothetical protein
MTIIAECKASPEFTRLAPSSPRAYLIYIKLLEDAFGDRFGGIEVAFFDLRIQIRAVTLQMAAIPRGAGMPDCTGLDRSHLRRSRRSWAFHHALIIPRSLALLHI